MNGALPPSSSDSFFTVAAHCAISILPTSVDPVNESLRTIGLLVSSPPISAAGAGDDVEDALRHAGALGELGQRERRERRLRRRLQHDGAAGGDRRTGLARDHRQRKIPRRDAGDDADRLLDDDDALVGLVPGNGVAVDALRFFAEPFEEGRRVGDLAARFGERLALLGGHQPREIFLVGDHQLEPAAQDGGALLRGLACATRERRAPRRRSPSRVSARPSFGTDPMISPVAGLSTSIAAPRALDPRAVDVAGLPEELRVGE